MSTVLYFLIAHLLIHPCPNFAPACHSLGWRTSLGNDAGSIPDQNVQVEAGVLAEVAARSALAQYSATLRGITTWFEVASDE